MATAPHEPVYITWWRWLNTRAAWCSCSEKQVSSLLTGWIWANKEDLEKIHRRLTARVQTSATFQIWASCVPRASWMKGEARRPWERTDFLLAAISKAYSSNGSARFPQRELRPCSGWMGSKENAIRHFGDVDDRRCKHHCDVSTSLELRTMEVRWLMEFQLRSILPVGQIGLRDHRTANSPLPKCLVGINILNTCWNSHSLTFTCSRMSTITMY